MPPVLKGVGFPGSAVRATSMDSDDDVPCRAGESCCACSGCLAADHARENGVFAWSGSPVIRRAAEDLVVTPDTFYDLGRGWLVVTEPLPKKPQPTCKRCGAVIRPASAAAHGGAQHITVPRPGPPPQKQC